MTALNINYELKKNTLTVPLFRPIISNLICAEYPFFKTVIISADYMVLSGVAVPIATPKYTTALASANCR
jgi:hypothetical protein